MGTTTEFGFGSPFLKKNAMDCLKFTETHRIHSFRLPFPVRCRVCSINFCRHTFSLGAHLVSFDCVWVLLLEISVWRLWTYTCSYLSIRRKIKDIHMLCRLKQYLEAQRPQNSSYEYHSRKCCITQRHYEWKAGTWSSPCPCSWHLG